MEIGSSPSTEAQPALLYGEAAVSVDDRVRRGSIINVSSIAGIAGQPIRVFAHAAAGAGLAVSGSMARELASHGIRSAIVPGMILNLIRRVGSTRSWMCGRGSSEDTTEARRPARGCRQHRLFFASDESSYITGTSSLSTVADG